MTTIAFDATSVAWDSQDTIGNRKATSAIEKVIVINNVLYGVAGDADCCEAVPYWHARGANLKKAPEGEWEMICVTLSKDGTPEARCFTHESPIGFSLSLPAAVGSGGRFAIAGMAAGMSAAEAVQLAGQLDIYTGPPFKTVEYTEWLKPLRIKKKKKTTVKTKTTVKKKPGRKVVK